MSKMFRKQLLNLVTIFFLIFFYEPPGPAKKSDFLAHEVVYISLNLSFPGELFTELAD